MFPLGIVYYIVVNINDKGKVRSFAKPTLKMDVVGSIYKPSLI
jgi:hypothetical protein